VARLEQLGRQVEVLEALGARVGRGVWCKNRLDLLLALLHKHAALQREVGRIDVLARRCETGARGETEIAKGGGSCEAIASLRAPVTVADASTALASSST